MHDARTGTLPEERRQEPPRDIGSLGDAVAGFALCGWRLPDGKIRLGPDKNRGEVIDAFPQCVQCGPYIYTYEEEKQFESGFINAEYM
jgi:hypothetical protein